MKNKILISITVLLILIIITVRFLFKERVEIFKISLSNYEAVLYENFIKEKEDKIKILSNGDKRILQLFNEQFNENKAIFKVDTSFSYLYLKKTITYSTYSSNYIDCLVNKCNVDKQNEDATIKADRKEKELEKKYGQTFLLWYPRLKDNKLLTKNTYSLDCGSFFSDLYKISYNESAWKEFEKFIVFYNLELRKVESQNKAAENQFHSNVSLTRNKLFNNVVGYFNEKVTSQKTQILKMITEEKIYNSTELGTISFDVESVKFDKVVFNSIADEAFEEQWKYNSLRTGAMPYSGCYGSSNSCHGWGCSQIKVVTGGTGDVLVTVKNSYGSVVRHAYIQSGSSFTFYVVDGSYQVFFYSGTGWNPNKPMISSSCSNLRGGFVLNENVSKDNYIHLNNQIMTYELILREHGNFSTKPSSKDEAF